MLSIPESARGAENENIGNAAGRTGKFAGPFQLNGLKPNLALDD